MPIAVLLGDINVDLLLAIPAYPPEGGEAIANSQVQQLGGSATNTAIGLARMGMAARMIGRVGSDAVGDTALADMAGAGVDTNWISRDPAEPTQTNIVVVSASGERTMFAYRGANARLAPGQIEPDVLEGAGMVHLSGYSLLQSPQRDAAFKLASLAYTAGIPVSLDIPAGVAAEIAQQVRRFAPMLDTVLLGEADIDQMGFATANNIVALGIRAVVVKRGAAGCLLVTAAAATSIPGLAVTVVDTTGAGDAMAAGIIAARLAGLAEDEACQLGATLGALTVGRVGAGLAMPTLREAEALLTTSMTTGRLIDALRAWIGKHTCR